MTYTMQKAKRTSARREAEIFLHIFNVKRRMTYVQIVRTGLLSDSPARVYHSTFLFEFFHRDGIVSIPVAEVLGHVNDQDLVTKQWRLSGFMVLLWGVPFLLEVGLDHVETLGVPFQRYLKDRAGLDSRDLQERIHIPK